MIREIHRTLRFMLFALGLCCVIYPASINLLSLIFHLFNASPPFIGDHWPTREIHRIPPDRFLSLNYFQGRPQIPVLVDSEFVLFGPSHLAASHPELKKRLKEREMQLRRENPTWPVTHKIPLDLLFASGSGLDPNISQDAAFFQLPRIALQRRLPAHLISKLILQNSTSPQLGEEFRLIDLQKLNFALDRLELEFRAAK